ncbi:DUF1905 domain-containing protein [Yimella sp. cx-573]|nr:DUF1905 domain-containing protein [Yimella sp. cx-573]
MTTLDLRTTIVPAGPAAAIVLSDEQVAQLGGAKTAPVTVTIGEVTVRARVARMGGLNMIGFRKELRTELGIAAGDEVQARIALDDAERTVDVPAQLSAVLAAEGLRERFDAWSYTRRKEAAQGVSEAKRDDTAQRRIAQVVAALRD